MKLKEFLQGMEKECVDMVNLRLDFDLGIDTDMSVNDKSHNRIKFTVIKKGDKKK